MSQHHRHGADLGNLPADTTAFVGRRRLLDAAGHTLSESRLLTLTGVGGVGKTRAAIQLGRARARAVPGGVWLVDLATLNGPDLVSRAVAATLGIHDQSQHNIVDTVVSHVREHDPLLLVLDNCEHVVTAVAELVDALLRRVPTVRILAASRQPLGVPGERVTTVPPMTVPAPEEVRAATSVDALAHHDSVRLFLDRASDTEAPVSDQDAAAVGWLVRALEGVPLAIELAAARTATMSVTDILWRLDCPLRVLAGTDHVAHPHHHHTLEATFTWSYDLCSPAEQRLWARLAVFTDAFDLAAAEAVAADDHISADDIAAILDRLKRQSLISVHRKTGGLRYRMLQTVRAYGIDRLIEYGEEAEIRRRHRVYYRTLTGRAARDHQSPRELAWMTRLRDELPNIRAALHNAVRTGDVDTGLHIVMNINRSRGWFFAGSLPEARHWSRTLLAADPDTPLRLPVLAGGAWIATCQGDRRSALSVIADCVRIIRRHECCDDTEVTRAMVAFIKGGYRMFCRSDVARAALDLADARDGFLRAGHSDEAHMARLCLAIATAAGDDAEAAFRAAEDCLVDAQGTGAAWSISWAQWAYGLAYLRHGDRGRAATLFTTALTTQQDTADHWGPPWSIAALGWHAAAIGDHKRAALLLGAAHRQRHAVGVDIHGITLLATLDADAENTARAALGETAYQSAYERGTRLSYANAVAAVLDHHVPARHDDRATHDQELDDLTRREHDIVRLLAADPSMTNKEMGARLYISVRTVDTHIAHILRKLGLTSRAQIAVWAATHR
jgi:predicted ATPase/DNA-binding CsgD family transcriptional regulator